MAPYDILMVRLSVPPPPSPFYFSLCLSRDIAVMRRDLIRSQDAVCRILGGNDKSTCRAIAERFEAKYDQSLVDALKKELRGDWVVTSL